MKKTAIASVEACLEQEIFDVGLIRGKVKTAVSTFLYKQTKRTPMVMPVLFEI